MFHFVHSHFVYGSGDSSHYDCSTWLKQKTKKNNKPTAFFLEYSKRPDIVSVFKIFNPDCFCSWNISNFGHIYITS